MFESNIWLLGYALLMGLGAYLVFLWAVKDGQFENCEDIKYQLFRENADD